MACCGQRRGLASVTGKAVEAHRPPRSVSRVVLYEYTGITRMTVQGTVSGLSYRFEQPGAKLQIDARDASSMAGIPNLRRLP
jgi:hypothetical protein